MAAMLDEHVPFFEGIRVEQQFDALAGRQTALGMLGLDALLAAACPRRRALLFKLFQDFLHGPAPRTKEIAPPFFRRCEKRNLDSTKISRTQGRSEGYDRKTGSIPESGDQE